MNYPQRARRNSRNEKREEKRKFDARDFNILRYETFDTLKLCEDDHSYYIETDLNFAEDVRKIAKIRKNMVLNIFGDEKKTLSDNDCDQIDHKARIHREANIVNSNTIQKFQNIHKLDKCHCGCQRGKGKSLPFCTDEQKLNVLGPGVLLMFLFKRTVSVILLMILLIYGLYALITNLLGSNAEIDSECQESGYCRYQREASDENKDPTPTLYLIQFWLGFVFSFAWIIALRFIKYLGKQKNALVDQKLRSASDYAVKIQNLPNSNYSQNQLINFFDGLYNQVENNKEKNDSNKKINEEQKSIRNSVNCFDMKSIQVIYNMQFARSMIEQIFTLCCSIDYCLLQPKDRKTNNYIRQVDNYRRYKNRLKDTYELLLDLRKRFLNDPEFRKKISTGTCIIEFKNQKKRKQLLRYFGKEKVGTIKKIQMNIKKCFGGGGNDLIFKGRVLSIERAPEPSDVQWINCQQNFRLRRILVIYTATFLIVMISFGILVGLQFLQSYAKDHENQLSSEENSLIIINYVMSVALLIVNKVLWFSLYYLLELEYNHTLTEKIISQMNKVLFASSINVIVLPIISNYLINQNLYGSDGLSGMVFDYHLGVIGGLAIKLFDPLWIIKKFIIAFRCIRNFVIRYLCANLNKVEPEEGVKVVNQFYEGTYFDIAENYVYIIGAFIHATFFCHLQPTILIMVTAMVIIFYFINRWKLLNYSKIPEMTDLLVFETALSQTGLVPIMYGTGSLVISYMERSINKDIEMPYISSFIAIGIGLIGIFNPCDILNKMVKKIIKTCKCLARVPGEDDSFATDSEEEKQANQTEQNILTKLPKQKQVKIQEDQIQEKNKDQTNRIEVYYENSNSLTLLGFERVLIGEEEKVIMKELQIFCQNFFPRTNQTGKGLGIDLMNDIFKSQKKAKGKEENHTQSLKNQSNFFTGLFSSDPHRQNNNSQVLDQVKQKQGNNLIAASTQPRQFKKKSKKKQIMQEEANSNMFTFLGK